MVLKNLMELNLICWMANSLYNFDCMHKKLPRGNFVWDGVRGDGI